MHHNMCLNLVNYKSLYLFFVVSKEPSVNAELPMTSLNVFRVLIMKNINIQHSMIIFYGSILDVSFISLKPRHFITTKKVNLFFYRTL